MFALDLPRSAMLLGVGLAHAAAVLAFTQMHTPARTNTPVMVMETLFFPTHQQIEKQPTPVVNLDRMALRIDTSMPRLDIESAVISDAPPSPKAPTAIVSSGVPAETTPLAVESVQYV